ncbi:L,D-transpeptidase [Aestuariivirga litoralis]|uniref:L,D-transpeptidase n=2 Tax=Aestuariivirga litoralis TaxID=2650924 RepID=A0A2W2B9Z0_9HYPH|nr:L,D-transpeptidase [Aestuariivirga litoralis]
MDLGPAARDADLLPPPESEIDYPITPAAVALPDAFQPQTVGVPDIAPAHSIIVDPLQHFLYHVGDDGTARRYGVGVGREGFAWSGRAVIGMKRRWPRWVPPRDMVQRDAKARKWANGQPGGPDNPLGARALYLYQDGQDTLYRIHGTNQPDSIGKSASSGCIRMLNEHVAELYDRVEVGTPVLVLADAPVVVQASG